MKMTDEQIVIKIFINNSNQINAFFFIIPL